MPVKPHAFSAVSNPAVHRKQYSRFRGVDFSTDPAMIDDSRSPMAVNLISDAGGFPEKRVGWEVLYSLDAPINGLHYFVDGNGNRIHVIHAATNLYTTLGRVTNTIDDGDFPSMDAWRFIGGSASVSGNVAGMTGDGLYDHMAVHTASTAECTRDQIFYFMCHAKPGTETCMSIQARCRFYEDATAKAEVTAKTVSVPVTEENPDPTPLTKDKWYPISGLVTVPATPLGINRMDFYLEFAYETAEAQLGAAAETKYWTAVNLTALYTAGKEPSATQMDAALLQYSENEWFDNTVYLDLSMVRPVFLSGSAANAKSTSFVHGGRLYILDGTNYLVYGGSSAVYNGDYITDVTNVAYAPTTVISAAPGGGGTAFEPVNLLQPKRVNSFVGNGGAAAAATLLVSSGATGTSAVSIVLNSAAAVSVSVASGDSNVAVATKIRNASFTGWITGGQENVVTFTASSVGARPNAYTFGAGTTGVLASILATGIGANAAAQYQLDATGLDAAAVTVTVGGAAKAETADFTVNRDAGVVTFNADKIPSSGNGVDNVVITFSKTVPGYADRIKKCRINTWFGMGNDSRVFVSGNPEYKNMDWMSGLYDPTYFPDTGYTKVGADSSAIMGYLRQYDNLLVVKADNEQDATVYMRTAEFDGSGNPIFPLKQGVAGIGAISMYAFSRLRDDPLFLAKEGVFTATLAYGSVNQQRSTQNRSFLVDARLIKEPHLEDAVSVVWNDWFLLSVNSRCYVADGKQKTGKSADESYGYEWFYWTNIPARVFLEVGGLLYFGDVDGKVCKFLSDMDSNSRFADNGAAIDASWASKLDDEGDYMLYKQIPRRGTGVLVKPYTRSSIDVYIRTDTEPGYLVATADLDIWDWGNMDFDHFSFNTQDAPYIIPTNTVVKNYKEIQIILRNNALNEGFGCFGITKRFIVRNYVK